MKASKRGLGGIRNIVLTAGKILASSLNRLVSFEELWRSGRGLSAVLLFIQNSSYFKNKAKACLSPSMLSLPSIVQIIIAKFFQIWSPVACYGELCVCF